MRACSHRTTAINRALIQSEKRIDTHVYVVLDGDGDGDRIYELCLEDDLDTFFSGCPVIGCAYNGKWDE